VAIVAKLTVSFGFVVVVVIVLFCSGACSVAHAGLKLAIPLLQPPKCWDCRRAPLCPTGTCLLHRHFLLPGTFFSSSIRASIA
jgi:hypothetical protein